MEKTKAKKIKETSPPKGGGPWNSDTDVLFSLDTPKPIEVMKPIYYLRKLIQIYQPDASSTP